MWLSAALLRRYEPHLAPGPGGGAGTLSSCAMCSFSPTSRALAEKPAGISSGLFRSHFSAWWLHQKLSSHVSKPRSEAQLLPLHHRTWGVREPASCKTNPCCVSQGSELPSSERGSCARPRWGALLPSRALESRAARGSRTPANVFCSQHCPGCRQPTWASTSLGKAGLDSLSDLLWPWYRSVA